MPLNNQSSTVSKSLYFLAHNTNHNLMGCFAIYICRLIIRLVFVRMTTGSYSIAAIRIKVALYNSSFLWTYVDLDFIFNPPRFFPEKAATLAADIVNELVQVSADNICNYHR